MKRVSGVASSDAQKSSDMFMKTQYMDEITGGKGVIFATGTPISNSIVELYTMQRYLQYNTLLKNNLQHFDSWASTFRRNSYKCRIVARTEINLKLKLAFQDFIIYQN